MCFLWLGGKKPWLAVLSPPPPQPWLGHVGSSKGGISASHLTQGWVGKGTLKVGPQGPYSEVFLSRCLLKQQAGVFLL